LLKDFFGEDSDDPIALNAA